MSDIIKLLPDSVANQIAAGEVIQRPASVIKELVENAIDAGADEIKIIIKDAGRTLIQVIDNGCGMSETDARLAFERHATSKIKKVDDLFSLQTMGFRGEALPSICAISQLELKTKRSGDNLGTQLIINGSRVESQEPCMCTDGSNFMVKNLFYNVPARRKFLKSDSVELNNILREFERLALVNNNVRMSIDTGTTRTFNLRAASFKQRIGDIWRGNLNMQLIPIDIDTSVAKISGFISKPEFARRRNPLQYFIVNGRNMKHPYFHKAITSCYENLIASETQPCYFIKFDVDPNSIDVNIHPTKNEIKFENEQTIWPILQASIKAALGKFSTVPAIDFSQEIMPLDPPRDGDFVAAPKIDLNPTYNPFENPYLKESSSEKLSFNRSFKSNRIDSDWDKLYANFIGNENRIEQKNIEIQADLNSDNESNNVDPLCIQYANKYIITTTQNGITIIDQYRAHLKILFEKFIARASAEVAASQRVMFPETVEFDNRRQLVFEEIEDELRRLGFMFEYIDDYKWNITGVPQLLGEKNPAEIVFKILDSIDNENLEFQSTQDNPTSLIIGKIALIMARSAAIKGGQRLSTAEMEHIISSLFSLSEPGFTPSGNPIIQTIDNDRIKQLFG